MNGSTNITKHHYSGIMYHNFRDVQGVHGATPFENLHQFLIGMMPYILESLYNYRSVAEVWIQFFNK